MSIRSPRIPSYRLHKPSGQAVVTLNGRDFYLGKHGTPASRAEYERLVAEWLTAGRQVADPGGTDRRGEVDPAPAPSDLTIDELILAHFRFVEGYYRKGGEATSEVRNTRLALRPLRQLYGRTPARSFGPLALKAVRQTMVDAGLARTEVNKRVRKVVRAFKWAVENELVPPAVHAAIKAVGGLRKGRTEARETEPVRPVADEHVDAIRPFVARQVWAMVELQRLTGMRPGEVTRMRSADIDTSGKVWAYTPERHMTEHHGKSRVIYLGPRAQEVVRPWLRADPAAYLFQPREAMAEFRAGQRAARRTPMTPSQRARARKRKPRRAPGERYLPTSYAHAVAVACRKAGVPHWHPNRLRHSAATGLRREFGLDVARVILGHSSPAVTEVYAEVDRAKAIAVMGRVG